MIPGPPYSPQRVSRGDILIVAHHCLCAVPCCSGRLYQVEYAMEAIEHAGTCLGILASDGVVMAAERKITNKLLDDTVFSEKIYRLDE